jgi:hypothetical protein
LALIYLANDQEIGCGDTLPARLLPVAILRGDGPFLDRFNRPEVIPPLGASPPDFVPPYARRKRGQLVSFYPVAPALLALPVYWPQVLVLDRLQPGWDRDDARLNKYTARMAKSAGALIAALAGVALYHLLRALGLGRAALPATVTAALGSPLWVEPSQSLWQHGPAALALTVAMALLVPQPVSRRRLFLAGLASAALVCFRPQDAVFAVVIFLWVVRYHLRDLAWFLPMPALLGAALLGYNYWFFGAALGGYSEVTGHYTTPLLAGMAGTLVSPSRGLFLFCPWVAVALLAAPAAVPGRLKSSSVVWWLAWGLVPYLLMMSKYTVWWGGHSFGSRYWADVVPLLAVLLACGLDWSWSRCRPAFAALGAAAALALRAFFIREFYYPTSSCNASPQDVDERPERLWDWRDNQRRRCLAEGPGP